MCSFLDAFGKQARRIQALGISLLVVREPSCLLNLLVMVGAQRRKPRR